VKNTRTSKVYSEIATTMKNILPKAPSCVMTAVLNERSKPTDAPMPAVLAVIGRDMNGAPPATPPLYCDHVEKSLSSKTYGDDLDR